LGLPRLYLENLDVYIYDLHNLVTLIVELVVNSLKQRAWQPELLTAELRYDLGLLGLAALNLVWMQLDRRRGEPAARAAWVLVFLLLLNGVFALVFLASLPTDPKNAWLLGYSAARLLLMSGLALASLLPLALLVAAPKRVYVVLDGLWTRRRRIGRWISLLLLMGLVFQLWAPLVSQPGRDAQIARLAPLLGWVMGLALLLLVYFPAREGRFSRSLREYWQDLLALLRRHPALIYFGWVFLLLLTSQINDKGFTHFTYFISFPDIGVPDWDNWTEEVLELAASLEILLAAAVIRFGTPGHSVPGSS
jgi:hypothetical protein